MLYKVCIKFLAEGLTKMQSILAATLFYLALVLYMCLVTYLGDFQPPN